MSGCCHNPEEKHSHKVKFDYLLWVSLSLVILGYFAEFFASENLTQIPWLAIFTSTTFELINKMWWGLLIGLFFVVIINQVPKEYVVGVLGKEDGFKGILRATLAGLMLDLCNHGILLIGLKLYQRGASLGQTMAFIIASPWNSFSLTLILWALIGFKWMMGFLLLSLLIALISGLIFEKLVKRGVLPDNPHRHEALNGDGEEVSWKSAKARFKATKFTTNYLQKMFKNGIAGSGMILRWIFVGVVLAGVIRAFVPADIFADYFGPTMAGLWLTLLAATIIEVCSEGSVPIASDLLINANAPGNAFTFLMAGAATDYTEIVTLKEVTKSWKISLFLPLVTVPQVLFISWILNQLG